MQKLLLIFKFLVITFFLGNSKSVLADSAEQLFAQLEPSLLQVRVLDKASGSKASIGTGFMLDEPSLLVTNYHVVSQAVLEPKKYQLEYLNQAQEKGELTVIAVDVINDLAVLKSPFVPVERFKISQSIPVQGATIYSLGNPHDLGMILVPGTYNGLKKYSFYPRIHFTGSVNSGMSGGPAVDAKGEVVGVNVASGGEQLAFLVPSSALITLLERAKEVLSKIPNDAHPQQTSEQHAKKNIINHSHAPDFNQQIEQQLANSQQKMFEQILTADWKIKEFGHGQIPDEVVPFVRCWGDSVDSKEDDPLEQIRAFCSQSEDIYLSGAFTTGRIEMQFEWIQGVHLHPLQFFHLYQQSIRSLSPDNAAEKKDVTQFECQQQVTQTQAKLHAKIVYCVRAYRKYAGLFDVIYLSASLDQQNQGLISHYTLAGVSQASAQAFRRKFSEAVIWR